MTITFDHCRQLELLLAMVMPERIAENHQIVEHAKELAKSPTKAFQNLLMENGEFLLEFSEED